MGQIKNLVRRVIATATYAFAVAWARIEGTAANYWQQRLFAKIGECETLRKDAMYWRENHSNAVSVYERLYGSMQRRVATQRLELETQSAELQRQASQIERLAESLRKALAEAERLRVDRTATQAIAQANRLADETLGKRERGDTQVIWPVSH